MKNLIVSSSLLKRMASRFSVLWRTFLLASVLSLICHKVMAFGAGELKILSSAQQPLKAEILLPRTAQDNTDDIQAVFVATETTYSQADLVYSDYLSQLNISLLTVGGGLLIEISAPQPLVGKLDLLLEFKTSEQQYMHFYGLTGSKPTPVSQPSLAQVSDQPFSQPSSQLSSQSISREDQSQAVRVHKVVEGDTLWNIAKRMQPEGMTVTETMNLLFEANTEAFQDGDITQIKRGVILNLKLEPVPNAQDKPSVLDVQQTADLPNNVEADTPVISESAIKAPVPELSEVIDNEEALEGVLQELAQEFAEEAKTEVADEASDNTVLTQLASNDTGSQASVTATALNNSSEISLTTTYEQLDTAPDASQQSEQSEQLVQIVKVDNNQQQNDQFQDKKAEVLAFELEQAPTQSESDVAPQLTQLLASTLARIEALLDWHFVHDPIDDHRKLLTWPWLGGALLVLILFVWLIKSLFKPRLKNKSDEIEKSYDLFEDDDLPESYDFSEGLDLPQDHDLPDGYDLPEDPYLPKEDKELAESPAQDIYDNSSAMEDSSGLDNTSDLDASSSIDNTAIYANRESGDKKNSASTSKYRRVYPEASTKSSADEDSLDEQAISFPGIDELDVQMSEEFPAHQTQSDNYQSSGNNEDRDDIDPVTVRLEMATICMEMNDNETAREILQEIILEAEEPAKAKAQAMLERLNTEMNG